MTKNPLESTNPKFPEKWNPYIEWLDLRDSAIDSQSGKLNEFADKSKCNKVLLSAKKSFNTRVSYAPPHPRRL